MLQLGRLWLDAQQRQGQRQEVHLLCACGLFCSRPLHRALCAGEIPCLMHPQLRICAAEHQKAVAHPESFISILGHVPASRCMQAWYIEAASRLMQGHGRLQF